jgi:cysteine desulfurase
MRDVYMDHAATTYTDPRVLEVMLPYFTEIYGNPSSLHETGRNARRAVETAREQVAKAINAKPQEVYFTAGGTESDNWALRIPLAGKDKKGCHIITSAIEHHAVLYACGQLEKEGCRVTYLPVDEHGRVSVQSVADALRDDTVLVSIMAANNEIGTLEPIREIGALLKDKPVLFHTDAVQAVGAVPIDVADWHVDMLSMSAHKFYGPKGIGALYVRRGIKMSSFIQGGAQERNHRAGTENVPGIVGMGAAIALAHENLAEESARLTKLRDKLIHGIIARIPEIRLDGHPTERLPNNVHFCFKYIEGESLLLSLDLMGIRGSSGSACTSGSLDPSHVLLALGLDHGTAHGSLRLTLGHVTTDADIDYVLDVLPGIVTKLRMMSPLFIQYEGGKTLV